MSQTIEAAALQGPVAVTAAYFGLWYAMLLGLQSRTKYRLRDEYAARGEVFDRYFGQDPRMLAADRAVANTLEQMGPFLVSLWLHAVLVSAQTATVLGASMWSCAPSTRSCWAGASRRRSPGGCFW